MARRRRPSTNRLSPRYSQPLNISVHRITRAASVGANRSRLRFTPLSRSSLVRTVDRTDGRRFQPVPPDTSHRLVAGSPSPRRSRSFSRQRVAFANPRTALVCVRRRERREVLFARGRAGSGNRPPKYRPSSKIAC